MKITIISRTILPLQTPRSFRATELAKEFASQGHEVILYAVLGNYNYENFERTHKIKVRNIGKMQFATKNSDGSNNKTFLNKVLTRLLQKLIEFPDIELAFKVAKLLKREKDIDLLISVAIPYPIHWGVSLYRSRCKNLNPNVWIADCGDPYMGNKFHSHKFYFKYVEKWFCKNADYLSVPIVEAKKGYYSEFYDKINVIPQGFNFEEFQVKKVEISNAVPTFLYAGAFYEGVRDPKSFLKFLSKKNIQFKFIIYTKSIKLVEPYIKKLVQERKIELRDYIPREKLLHEMSKVDFLVNFENGTDLQSPSKLIDYALVKRPILSINSTTLDQEEVDNFLNGDYSGRMKIEDLQKYNIKKVAKSFLDLYYSKKNVDLHN